MKIAFLFPGQGAAVPGALDALAAHFHEVREVMREADAALRPFGLSLRDEATSFAARQFDIVATNIAVYEVLRRRGVEPAVLLGHSLGEIPALYAAGVLDLPQTFAVVAHRVRAIEAGGRKGGLVAVAADSATGAALVNLVRHDCAVAVVNGPGQIVLSVPEAAQATLDRVISALGLSATRLDAAWPFHGPAMVDAAARFGEALGGMRFSSPTLRIDSPMYGPEGWARPEDVAARLAGALVRPVDFAAAVARLQGVEGLVECGGRRALTALAGQVLGPHVKVWTPLLPDSDIAAALLDIVAQTKPVDYAVVDRIRMLLDEARALLECLPADGAPAPRPRRSAATDAPTRTAVPAPAMTSHPKPAAPVPPQPTPETRPPTPAPTTRTAQIAPGHAEVEARVVILLQRLTEYPADVFEPDADFEADLGIDSLKQVTVLTEVQREFQLPARTDLRVKDYNTLARVVALVVEGLGSNAVHGAA
jgi:[acyl-carrier-protein] S-malonyltransferase